MSNDNIVFEVRVKPGSKVEGIELASTGVVVVKVRARPVEGAANKAVIEALSEHFSIAKSRIFLVSGAKSKVKRFAISFLERDDKEIRERIEKFING